jgi:hypothetical protein
MVDKAAGESQFNWRLPLYAAVGALIVFLPFIIYAYDIGEVLYLYIGVPIVSLIFLVVFIFKKRRLAVFSMLVVYWAVTWVLFQNSFELRSAGRWLLWSKTYKAEVLAQPESPNGELRHIDWDGWGWGGNDTTVYLVYDPADSLSVTAKSHSSGKFDGIPCKVPRVRRLESYWYFVVFYTNTAWGRCN